MRNARFIALLNRGKKSDTQSKLKTMKDVEIKKKIIRFWKRKFARHS
jgi:hypothetical protein